MTKLDIKSIKEAFSTLATNAPDGSIFKLNITGQDGIVVANNKLQIPSYLASGIYTVEVYLLNEESDPDLMLKAMLEIPEKEKKKEEIKEQPSYPTPTIQQQAINSSSEHYEFYLKLREQDTKNFQFEKEMWAKEKDLISENNKLQIELVTKTKDAEIAKIKEIHAIQISSRDEVAQQMEREREKVFDSVDKQLRSEFRRAGKGNDNNFLEGLVSVVKGIAEQNPEIISMLLSRFIKTGTSEVNIDDIIRQYREATT